jgi:hypothetical protein
LQTIQIPTDGENYISLLPDEERNVIVEFPTGSAKPAIGVRGWNLATTTLAVD